MFDPGIGRWLEQDPIGFEANDLNLFRYARNSPICSSDPNGLDSIPMSIQYNRNFPVQEIQKVVDDRKLGYDFKFDYVLRPANSGRTRYFLQALKSFRFTVHRGGNLSKPEKIDNEGYNYIVDQRNLLDGQRVVTDWRVKRVRKQPAKDKDIAVLTVEITESIAGTSDLNYKPRKGGGGQVLSGSQVDKEDYEYVLKGITGHRTEAKLVYVYYNPTTNQGVQFCNNILEQNKIDLKKLLGGLADKVVLGNKPFELLSFPSLFTKNDPLTTGKEPE